VKQPGGSHGGDDTEEAVQVPQARAANNVESASDRSTTGYEDEHQHDDDSGYSDEPEDHPESLVRWGSMFAVAVR
jgi:hypothetical protein